MLEGCGGYSHDAIAEAASITDQQSQKMPKKSPKTKVAFFITSGPNIAESFATVLSVAHYMILGSSAPFRRFPRFCSFSFLGIYGYYLSIYLSLFYYLIDRLYPEKPRKEMPT